MLVVNGELVAVAKRVPGHVVGDGEHTIAELVDDREPGSAARHRPREGADPARARRPGRAHAGASRATRPTACLPPASRLPPLDRQPVDRRHRDRRDRRQVHPDNREMAVRAVKAIGLDVGGVDFLTTDITESYKDIGGGICEVNAAPGLPHARGAERGHAARRGRPGASTCCSRREAPSRIPIAAITGTNGKTTTARMLAHIHEDGRAPRRASPRTDGVYIDGQRTVEGDMTGPVAARMVLRDPKVDVAVLETARGGLLRAGMGVPAVQRRRGAQRQVRPSRSPRHRHARAARRGQAHRGRGGARDAPCSTPTIRSASRWPTTPRPSTSATSR